MYDSGIVNEVKPDGKSNRTRALCVFFTVGVFTLFGTSRITGIQQKMVHTYTSDNIAVVALAAVSARIAVLVACDLQPDSRSAVGGWVETGPANTVTCLPR